jgi:tetratricopeptide (TPR) repeat protein
VTGINLPRASSRVAIAIAVVLASCRTAAPPRITRVPDPLAPPVAGGPLSPEQTEAVQETVAAAEAGRFAVSEKHLRELPPVHPVSALVALEVRFLQGEKVARRALAFAADTPGYGSAWGFAALAARREGDLRGALRAAKRAAELQPAGGWGMLAVQLDNAITTSLVEEGNSLLEHGNAGGALTRAREVLETDPEAVSARLLAVRALLALHDTRGAAELVPGLPDSSEGLEVKGEVAEALRQWDVAVDLYTRLPARNPRRCALLASARRHWRLGNAPPYLTEALETRPLRRRGLAAIVAFEAPALAARTSGPVPVYGDVVQLPERSDIVAVARLGVLPGDPITHRFDPQRVVSPSELAVALENLARVLGKAKPRFCDDGATGCLKLPATVDGETADLLVRQVAGEGGEPCAQR